MNNESPEPNINQAQQPLPAVVAPSPAGPFYAPLLSAEEHADLTSGARASCLEDEIALLRTLLRRHLAPPPSDHLLDGGATWCADAVRVARLVHTLCRAIRASRSAGNTLHQQLNAALPQALADLAEEQGFPFADPPPWAGPLQAGPPL
ncbi:MAG: hypothetical protein HY675_00660 [Chloroflexi bacterium]|nr:hypothetical protein [Chloroflexota bacterium]